MLANRLKTAWAAGRSTLNGWLSVASPFVAEIMAAQGYDSLTVDLQHGAVDYSAKAVGWGYAMTTVANDVGLMAGAAAASTKRFRNLTAGILLPARAETTRAEPTNGSY